MHSILTSWTDPSLSVVITVVSNRALNNGNDGGQWTAMKNQNPTRSERKDLRWLADEDCEFWTVADQLLCSSDQHWILAYTMFEVILIITDLFQILFVRLFFFTRFFRRFSRCFLLARFFQLNLQLVEDYEQSHPHPTFAAAITSKCFGKPSSIDESDPPSSLDSSSDEKSSRSISPKVAGLTPRASSFIWMDCRILSSKSSRMRSR